MSVHEGKRAFIQDRLREEGYVASPYPLSPDDMSQIASGFVNLVSELFENPSPAGREVVDALRVSYPGQVDSSGFIVRRRVGDTNPYENNRGPGTDNKDLFHYTPLTPLAVRQAYGPRKVPKEVTELVEGCREIHLASRHSLQAVLEPLSVNRSFISPFEEGDLHVVRLINYPPGQKNNMLASLEENLAETHFDRNIITVAPWESSPGFYGAPGDNLVSAPELTLAQLHDQAQQAVASPLPHQPDQAKVFIGAGFHHLPEELKQKIGKDAAMLGHGSNNPYPGLARQAIASFAGRRYDLVGLPEIVAGPEECKFSFLEQAIKARDAT